MVRNRQRWAVVSGLAAVGVLAWLATAGSAIATAATRYRSGSVRGHLVSHVSPASPGAKSGIVTTGADAMAIVVAVMAFVALGFLIVTLVRRRVASD
jgi:hypothetical protein